MCLPVYNCLSVCLRICSAPVQKHVGSQYVIFHFVLANKLFWWVCQYRKSCQYVVNLILMSVQKNTLFASIFFFHTVCQYIFFSFCTGIGKCWYASTKKSILYWHEDRDFYDDTSSSHPPRLSVLMYDEPPGKAAAGSSAPCWLKQTLCSFGHCYFGSLFLTRFAVPWLRRDIR